MRKLRQSHGWTLREVAGLLGTSYSRLSLLENGKRAWNLKLVEGYRRACR
jgi:transcriptional regulator with XRE-family HTH domain